MVVFQIWTQKTPRPKNSLILMEGGQLSHNEISLKAVAVSFPVLNHSSVGT